MRATMPLMDRVLRKVAVGTSDECWSWLGFIDKAGYGRIRLGRRETPVGYAHRVMYEQHKGAIPEGLHIDHLCRNRTCVNPAHLEAVTPGENVRRGMSPTVVAGRADTCGRGHSLIEHGYTRRDRTGTRQCRECPRERRRAGAA